MPFPDAPTGGAREFRSAATRLERIARQLPPDSKAQVNETIQLLRDHADCLGGNRLGAIAIVETSTER